jgi:sec-independent protein translocase protein TatA
MGADSLWHWIIVILIVFLLFGRGKVSELMGDVAHGIKGFKKVMADEESEGDAPNSKQVIGKTEARTSISGRSGTGKEQ